MVEHKTNELCQRFNDNRLAFKWKYYFIVFGAWISHCCLWREETNFVYRLQIFIKHATACVNYCKKKMKLRTRTCSFNEFFFCLQLHFSLLIFFITLFSFVRIIGFNLLLRLHFSYYMHILNWMFKQWYQLLVN